MFWKANLPANPSPPSLRRFTTPRSLLFAAPPARQGPRAARAALKRPAADLTTLSNRHGREFPRGLVSNILRFGPGVAAHSSSDMPTRGSLFQYLDSYNRASVGQRARNPRDCQATLLENSPPAPIYQRAIYFVRYPVG